MNIFAPQQKSNLFEVKAGKLIKSGNILTADKRKGLLFIYKEDDLLHFCWKERSAPGQAQASNEDDLIVFPNDAEFKKIDDKNAFVLKFKTSAQRMFYWLQEEKEAVSVVNKLLGFIKEEEVVRVKDDATITPDLLTPVLQDATLKQELFPLLPNDLLQNGTNLAEFIKTTQFQQAVQSLDSALMSGDLNDFLTEQGINAPGASSNGNRVKALLEAIKQKSNRMEQ